MDGGAGEGDEELDEPELPAPEPELPAPEPGGGAGPGAVAAPVISAELGSGEPLPASTISATMPSAARPEDTKVAPRESCTDPSSCTRQQRFSFATPILVGGSSGPLEPRSSLIFGEASSILTSS